MTCSYGGMLVLLYYIAVDMSGNCATNAAEGVLTLPVCFV